MPDINPTETSQGAKPKGAIVALTLILALCYTAHWFPFDFIAVFQEFPAWLSVSIIGGALLLRFATRKFYPTGFRVLSIVYYIAVGAYALCLAYFVFLMNPLRLGLIALIGAALCFVLIRFKDRRAPLLPFFALLLVSLVLLPHPVLRYGGIFFLLFALPALLRLPPQKIGRAALFFGFLICALTMELGRFYYGCDESKITEVLAQTGVEAIILPSQFHGKEKRLLGRQIRYAADNIAGTHTIIGTDSTTVGYRHADKKIFPILDSNSTDGVAYVPGTGEIVTGNYRKQELVLLKDEDLSVLHREKSQGHLFTNVRFDLSTGNVLAGDDGTRDITIFSPKQKKILETVPAAASRDALRDSKTGRLIATTLRRVRWMNPSTGEVTAELKVPSIQIRLAMDAKNRLLYLSSFSSGRIWRVNMDTLEVEKKVTLEPGIRFLAITKDGSRLFASGYFKGNLYELTLPDLTPQRKIFAGQRLRTLHIAPNANSVVFGSSLGAFRLRF